MSATQITTDEHQDEHISIIHMFSQMDWFFSKRTKTLGAPSEIFTRFYTKVLDKYTEL